MPQTPEALALLAAACAIPLLLLLVLGMHDLAERRGEQTMPRQFEPPQSWLDELDEIHEDTPMAMTRVAVADGAAPAFELAQQDRQELAVQQHGCPDCGAHRNRRLCFPFCLRFRDDDL